MAYLAKRNIAGRYVKALIGAAKTKKDLDQVEKDLLYLQACIDAEPQLLKVLRGIMIASQDKKDVLLALLKSKSPSDYTKRLFDVLADEGRFAVLPAVGEVFQEYQQEQRGEIKATVKSAFALTAAAKKKLEQFVEKETGKKPILDVEVDKTLLNGFVVRVGSKMYDASWKSKLDYIAVNLR